MFTTSRLLPPVVGLGCDVLANGAGGAIVLASVAGRLVVMEGNVVVEDGGGGWGDEEAPD